MRLFAAVRDPREYRRGMVLGLTLAETLLLLMFLLLMALGALLWRREAELAAAKTDAATATAKAAHEQREREKLTSALASLIPELWERGVAVPDAQTLAVKLVEAERARRQIDELASSLTEVRADLAEARRQRDALATRVQELERQLGPEGADLPSRLQDLERQRDDLHAGLAREQRKREQAETELRDLRERIRRGGSLYPPCGPDEFSFRVTILDQGRAIVEDISTPAGRRHEAWELIRPFPRGTPISLSQFLGATRAYAEWGHARQPECRFGVRVLDRTSAANKDGYKAAMGSLGSPPNFRPFWRVGG